MNIPLIHQLMEIWVISPFWLLMDNPLMAIHVQVFVWTYVFNSLGYIPRREGAVCMVTLKCNFWRNHILVF